MKLTPRNGLVTITPIEDKETKTKTGIILPASLRQLFEVARVVAVGRGVFDFGNHVATDDLKPGMLVLVKSGSRMSMEAIGRSIVDLTDGDKKIGLCNQSDILAIIDEETPAPLALTQ